MTWWLLRMIEEQDHRDDEDRLIREGRTPAELIRPGEIEYKPCTYGGSRFQHELPMNVSALRQMSGHWSDILDAMAVMRGAYVEQRGEHVLELMDLWRVGQLASSLPWFFILRDGGTHAPPAYAAALAKITQGVGLWAQRVMVDWLAGTWTPEPLTPQAIYDSTDGNDTLIGEREVCSGPEKMMIRFFEVLVAGTPAGESPQIARLSSEAGRALLFGAHYANLKLLLWIHFLARRFVYADLAAAFGADHALSPQIAELLDATVEPADFFVVGPPDQAAVEPASRGIWFARLAGLVLPMAPDGSDAPLQISALAIGLALAQTSARPGVADEIARLHGLAPDRAEVAARAIATYARLDALLREIASTVEGGFRRSDPAAGPAEPFDAAARDRLLLTPPRAVLAQIAPESLAALCPP
jgi:hypothetical protein